MKFYDWGCAKACKPGRSRHEFSNEDLVAKVVVDMAENEIPCPAACCTVGLAEGCSPAVQHCRIPRFSAFLLLLLIVPADEIGHTGGTTQAP